MTDKTDWGLPYYDLPFEFSSRIIHDHGWKPPKKGLLVPAQMAFGSITAGGQSAQQIATLENAGYLPLSVNAVEVSGDWVMSTDCPIGGLLDVGKTCSVKLTFNPSRAGMQNGSLYIDTGDAQGNENIALLGYGLASGKGSAGLSASSLDFGNITAGTSSAVKSITLSNLGDVDLVVTSITATGEFSVTSSAPITLVSGTSTVISVKMSPLTAGAKTGSIAISHNGTGATSIALTGVGVTAAVVPTLTIANAIIEPYLDQATVTLSATSIAYDNTTVGAASIAKSVLLSNSGLVDANITGLAITGDFALDPTSAQVGGKVLANSGTAVIKVVFNPTAAGARVGTLAITTDAATGGAFNVALGGTGVAVPVTLDRLAISGNQFVKASDATAKVRLKSINWFGAEGTNYTPHGTWIRPWKAILDDIKSMGFNCVRMPFSGDFTTAGRTPPTAAIDASSNPDLVGLNSLEILDMYLDYCNSIGLYVVFDHHLRTAGQGADGSPISDSYTIADWKASWAVMANRYANHPAVVGADLHNEPHDLTWTVWAGYVETCANYLLTLAPLWLYFVEGVGTNSDSTSTWWGGALKDVATRPITLTVANKVAYSPHEYGQSTGSQAWLSTDSSPVAGYPNNLYAVWDANWGFIYKTAIAPIWIGEFGGKFGVDGSGVANQPNGTPESQWVTTLAKYLNGDFNGDGASDLTGTNKGLSFAYWAYNPNSGDTGGILEDDWITHQTVKLGLIAPLLA